MISGSKQPALLQQPQDLTIENLSKVLVVAPHPDDESLGCGGTIALLRQAGILVNVIFTSDGSMSHPHSVQYPAVKLVALREAEALAALQILGVPATAVHFMRLKDSLVAGAGASGFDASVADFNSLLQFIAPEVLLLPWRRDPHKDHRATWQIVNAAIQQSGRPVRQLEYLIWLWERGEPDEWPTMKEASIWQVNINPVKHLKKKAIAQHVSQTTRLINDDPNGFILSPEVLAHFESDYEIFIEIAEQ